MSVRTRSPLAFSAAAILSLGVVACTPAERNEAEVRADTAADRTAEAAGTAADRAGAVAAQTGEVIESGALKAARAVEGGAASVADRLEENQAQAAAEGRPGAVDPATGERVPAP